MKIPHLMLAVWCTAMCVYGQNSAHQLPEPSGNMHLEAHSPEEANALDAFNRGSALSYRPNLGQVLDTDGNPATDVLYVAEGPGMKVYFRTTGLSYVFAEASRPKVRQRTISGRQSGSDNRVNMHRVDLEFDGANPASAIRVEGAGSFYTNYYLAHHPEGITHVPSYSKVVYENLYPGIDWILYLDEGLLRYDLNVRPGADPNTIRMAISGSEDFYLDQQGALVVQTPMGTITEKAPEVFQGTEQIAANYTLSGNRLTFQMAEYDPNQPLLIDPVRKWATLFGGQYWEFPAGCATDGEGNVYIHGVTESTDFPVSTGAYQGTFAGTFRDAFVVKFDAEGNRLWATYFGGSSDEGNGWGYEDGGCATDPSGNVIIAGKTASTDLPVTTGAFQISPAGMYLAKFDGTGSLVWSTYYGGSGYDIPGGCVTDGLGNVYMHGSTGSYDFPVSTGAYQGTFGGGWGEGDAFLAKFDGNGNRLWATYFGGSEDESGLGGCAIDVAGNVFLTGYTTSFNFPVTSGAYQSSHAGGWADAYIAKFDPTGGLLWSTYYGSPDYDAVYLGGCATDAAGNVFFHGFTESTNLPGTSGGFQSTYPGGWLSSFLAKMDGNGNLVWATYFGGTADDFATGGCVVDGDGNVYIHGTTESSDLPVTPDAAQMANAGGLDAYLARFDNNGNQQYTTYYGSSTSEGAYGYCATGPSGSVIIYGATANTSFPTTAGAEQENLAGMQDIYLVKFGPEEEPCEPPIVTIISSVPPNGNEEVTLYQNPPPGSGLPASTTLEADVSPGGTSGYTYQWLYRDMPGNSWIPCGQNAENVVHANGTFYREYMSEVENGSTCSESDVITVRSQNVSCGNNKVWVCHYPPGNPNNPTTICVNNNALKGLLKASPYSYLGQCSGSAKRDDYMLEGMANLAPNPTTGMFTLSYSESGEKALYVQVFDMQGRSVLEQQIGDYEHAFHMEFDLRSQASGLYTVRILGESGVFFTGKMVKLE